MSYKILYCILTIDILCLVFGCEEVSALNLFDGLNQNFSIEEDKPPNEEYAFFIGRIRADSDFHPAVVINGLSAATDEQVLNNEKIAFCHAIDDDCVPVVGIATVPIKGNIVFVKAFMASYYSNLLRDNLYDGHIENLDSCVSVAYDHRPITFTKHDNDRMECSSCRHLDGIFCGKKVVGVLTKNSTGPVFNILDYEFLLKYANRIIGDDDQNIHTKVRNVCAYIGIYRLVYVFAAIVYGLRAI